MLLTLLACALLQQESPAPTYPKGTALAVGLDPEALQALDDLVLRFVQDGDLPGAEILVIKNRRTVLHSAHGVRDTAPEMPLEPGTARCIKSFRGPVISAAILMLDGDRALDLDDPLALHLPAMEAGDGTIEERLRSGEGTEVLTAIIEKVTEAPAEEFLRARILDPLGMGCRPCNVGAEGQPKRPQGLESSALDQARFLGMWLRRGRGPEGRVMKASALRLALKPGPPQADASTGFPGLEVRGGSPMRLWVRPGSDPGKSRPEVVGFGYGGGRGLSAAWAFPDSRAVVVFMASAPLGATALRVEEALDRLLLGKPFDPLSAAPPLEPYLGYYREDKPSDRYRAIVRDGDGLALDVLGKSPVPLVYAGGDRWKLEPRPATVIEFDRDTSGRVTGYHIGDHREFRITPAKDLPSAADVAARIADTHRVQRLKEVGGIVFEGSLTMESVGGVGTWRAIHGSDGEWRVDEAFSGGETAQVAFDGTAVRTRVGAGPVEPLEPGVAELLSMHSLVARFGGEWGEGEQATVVQRVNQGDTSVLLVRLGDTSAPAATLYIDEERWLVARIDGPTHLPDVGRIGRSLEFGDFRAVEGMYLPFKSRLRLDSGLVGAIVSTVTEHSTGPVIPEGLFRLE